MASNRRSYGGEGRNRRMFASIQATLGGSAPPREPRRQTRLRDEEVEPLPDLESILTQLTDLSRRRERSATQIKKNLLASSYLEEMDEEEWQVLCKALVDLAMNRNETEFVVDLFITLLKFDLFKTEICGELLNRANSFIFEADADDDAEAKPSVETAEDGDAKIEVGSNQSLKGEDSDDPETARGDSHEVSSNKSLKSVDEEKKDDTEEGGDEDAVKEVMTGVPELLGAILCAGWPRHLAKAIETVNPVLYTTLSIVKGWIIVVGGEHEGDVRMLDRCALGLTEMCTSVQRSLWMRWPEVCDEIYAAIKPAITHSNLLSGKRKSGLLHVLISMHSWTKPKTVTMLAKCTQTVD